LAEGSSANDLVGKYETLRSQVLGTPTGAGGIAGWVVLVGRGLAAWMASIPMPPAIRSSSAPTAEVLPRLHSQIANILITMIASHHP
jgi:hypothetical protein